MSRAPKRSPQNSARSELATAIAACRSTFIAVFLFSGMSNILMLTGSIFMLQVYDRVLPSRSVPTLVALTVLAAMLYGFYALIEWIRARMAARLGGLVHEQLSRDVFQSAVRQKLMSASGS